MNVTNVVRGASRLPLTSKRGNKDFYKGTGQSYVPGGGHRTGPPGKHVIGGKSKYRVMDEKVRYFVGPGVEVLRETSLRPYVSAKEMQDNPPLPTRYNASNPPLSFSPNAYHASLLVPRHSAPSSSASSSSSLSSPSSTTTSSPLPTTAADSDSTTPQTDASKPLRIKAHDTKSFSKWYRDLPFEERNKLVQETRKNWYLEMVKRGK